MSLIFNSKYLKISNFKNNKVRRKDGWKSISRNNKLKSKSKNNRNRKLKNDW